MHWPLRPSLRCRPCSTQAVSRYLQKALACCIALALLLQFTARLPDAPVDPAAACSGGTAAPAAEQASALAASHQIDSTPEVSLVMTTELGARGGDSTA